MIDKLFTSLHEDKASYLNAKEGSEFEDRIKHFLKSRIGLNQIFKDQVSDKDWKAIKNHVCGKLGEEFMDIPNPELKRTFIYQPYGSQAFPDLIVFTDSKVVLIEVKFSTGKSTSPMWNSNVPRGNAFYIFGSYGIGDITFFLGGDVLSAKHREGLYKFFEEIRETQEKIRQTMPDLDETDRGFTPYIRAAFAQSKHKPSVQANFFAHPKRNETEEKAIELASRL